MSDKANTPKYVFGPAPSRRLGRSLGIDLVPYKICTFDCTYCDLGRTTHKTVSRGCFIATEEIQRELEFTLSGLEKKPYYITLSGSGEPTLNWDLGEDFVFPLTLGHLEEIRERLGDKAEVISDFAAPLGEESNSVKDTEILNLIKRRPCTIEEISKALGLCIDEVVKRLDHLRKTGAIRYRIYEHRCYYETAAAQ